MCCAVNGFADESWAVRNSSMMVSNIRLHYVNIRLSTFPFPLGGDTRVKLNEYSEAKYLGSYSHFIEKCIHH